MALTDQGRAMQTPPAASILVAGGTTGLGATAQALPFLIGAAIGGGLQLGVGSALLFIHRDALGAMVRGAPPRDVPVPEKKAPTQRRERVWPNGETITE